MCACSNKVNNDEKLPKAYCDVPCDVTDKSPQKFCGGKDSYSVYLGNYWLFVYVLTHIL